jgi:ClpP class serine protease
MKLNNGEKKKRNLMSFPPLKKKQQSRRVCKMSNELVLMKPSYYCEREAKREKLLNDVSYLDEMEKRKADDLDAQYKRVFSVKNRTAKISITGPLSQDGPDWIDVYLGYGGTAYKNIIRAANESKEFFDKDDIDNVVVRMNTPGGYVDGVDHAYQALKQIGDIGIVKNDGMIASGGVWLASAFNRIEPTTDTAIIGSIGVVATFIDWTGYYDNWGVKVIDITNKESPNKRPDATQKEGFKVIQKELDDIYNVFVSKVTAARPITKKDIDSLKGEVLIASKAIDFGLMDKPQNGDTPVDAENENNNNETEVSKLEGKKIVKDEPVIIDLVTPAIEAERSRIYGLAKISGLEMSQELVSAINDGTEVGDYAVAQVEAKEAREKAEIEAAKKLREENPGQVPGKIIPDNHGTEKEKAENDKLDKMLDKNFEKKGGKK